MSDLQAFESTVKGLHDRVDCLEPEEDGESQSGITWTDGSHLLVLIIDDRTSALR